LADPAEARHQASFGSARSPSVVIIE